MRIRPATLPKTPLGNTRQLAATPRGPPTSLLTRRQTPRHRRNIIQLPFLHDLKSNHPIPRANDQLSVRHHDPVIHELIRRRQHRPRLGPPIPDQGDHPPIGLTSVHLPHRIPVHHERGPRSELVGRREGGAGADLAVGGTFRNEGVVGLVVAPGIREDVVGEGPLPGLEDVYPLPHLEGVAAPLSIGHLGQVGPGVGVGVVHLGGARGGFVGGGAPEGVDLAGGGVDDRGEVAAGFVEVAGGFPVVFGGVVHFEGGEAFEGGVFVGGFRLGVILRGLLRREGRAANDLLDDVVVVVHFLLPSEKGHPAPPLLLLGRPVLF
mmetsp:Transcript_9449/g.17467  ORF Transcript_9449/g.17467 Transcript_9449/m.17467 type:complete len:321 (-) Transcript_9449:6-968(-)